MNPAHDRPSRPEPRHGFGTRALRAATAAPRVEQAPGAVPIYQSATFDADDAAQLGDILADQRSGYAYARIDNPTAVALVSAVAELEGAPAGYALASGMAAIHAALLTLASSGDEIVASSALYGGSYQLLANVLPRLGIVTRFVDATDPDAVEVAMTERTRALHVETIVNPTMAVPDLAALAERAHRQGVALVVDNTFASPYLCRPYELGADLVVESGTKWLGGHSDVLAGIVVGNDERVAAVRALQIDTGASLAPLSAFLVLRGLATLHVRMERHSASALALARRLEAAPEVRAVFYPGLASHPNFAVAQRQLSAGGGMLAFDLGDRRAAAAFLDALVLPPRTASLGSVRTICVHPPSTTHRQLDDAALEAAGIRPGLIRVSVGLEDVDDLITDFEHGLAAARSAAPGATTSAVGR